MAIIYERQREKVLLDQKSFLVFDRVDYLVTMKTSPFIINNILSYV